MHRRGPGRGPGEASRRSAHPDRDAPAPARPAPASRRGRATRARKARSSLVERGQPARRAPGGPRRASTSRVRPLWSQRRKATALVSSDSDSRVVHRRPPCGQDAARRRPASTHLDGDAAAQRLVDDDPRVAVELRRSRRARRPRQEVGPRHATARGARAASGAATVGSRRGRPRRPATRTAPGARAVAGSSSGCHCTPSTRTGVDALDGLDDAVVGPGHGLQARRRPRRPPGGAAC